MFERFLDGSTIKKMMISNETITDAEHSPLIYSTRSIFISFSTVNILFNLMLSSGLVLSRRYRLLSVTVQSMPK